MQASPEEPATGPPLDEGPAKPVISTQVPSSSIQAQDSPGSQQQDETPTVEPTQLSAVAASENQQQTSGQATSLPHIPSTGGGLKKGPRSSVQPPRRPASHLDAAPRLSARQAAKRQRMAQVQALNEDADEKTAAELLLGMQSLSGSQGDSEGADQIATADHPAQAPSRPTSGGKRQGAATTAQAPSVTAAQPAPAAPATKAPAAPPAKALTASVALPTPDLPRVSTASAGTAPAPAPAGRKAAAEKKSLAETAAAQAAAAEAAAAAAAAEAAGLRRSDRKSKGNRIHSTLSSAEEGGDATQSEDEYAPGAGTARSAAPKGAKGGAAGAGAGAGAAPPSGSASGGLPAAVAPVTLPTPALSVPAAAATSAPAAAAVSTPVVPAPTSAAAGGGSGTITTLVPQKSELTLLCERFQQQFGHLQPDGSPTLLMLNDVAEVLGVPRRRLYDVINVFESIEVMRRVGKLMYEWMGFDHLPALLEQLAQEEESGVPVEDRIRRAPTIIIVNEQGEELGSSKANSHSLWVLSRRLVRMLLKHEGPIALTSAAAILVGPGGVSDPSQHRSQTQITVERRLYDIGSILCSIGLIARIYVKKRQPAFEWTFGWKPGDSHPPPKLQNSYAPTEGLILNKPAGVMGPGGGSGSASRKRPGASRGAAAYTPQHILMQGAGGGGGSAGKRQKNTGGSSGVKLSGLVPMDSFGGMGGMMMHPFMMMQPMGGAGGAGVAGQNAAFMAAMGGMMMPTSLAMAPQPAGAGAGDKTLGSASSAGASSAASMPAGSGFFMTPWGMANPMGMQMGGMAGLGGLGGMGGMALNPAGMTLQQAQQVMGIKPEGEEEGKEEGEGMISAAAQQQAMAALRAVAGLPMDPSMGFTTEGGADSGDAAAAAGVPEAGVAGAGMGGAAPAGGTAGLRAAAGDGAGKAAGAEGAGEADDAAAAGGEAGKKAEGEGDGEEEEEGGGEEEDKAAAAAAAAAFQQQQQMAAHPMMTWHPHMAQMYAPQMTMMHPAATQFLQMPGMQMMGMHPAMVQGGKPSSGPAGGRKSGGSGGKGTTSSSSSAQAAAAASAQAQAQAAMGSMGGMQYVPMQYMTAAGCPPMLLSMGGAPPQQ